MSKRQTINLSLAHQFSAWLVAQGCTVTVVEKGEVYEVYYTLKYDSKPQPAVVIDGGVKFPAGSQQAVVQAYLMRILR